MPSTLVYAPGAVDANAYCSVAEADAYHDDLPVAAVRLIWTAAATADKTRAILVATRLIDRAFEFVGIRVQRTQPLAWPRYLSVPITAGYGYSYGYGTTSSPTEFYIDPATIPDRVKQATAEYARQLLLDDRTADSEIGSQGIKRFKADVVEVEFDSPLRSKPVPDVVALLLSGIGYQHDAQASVSLIRV